MGYGGYVYFYAQCNGVDGDDMNGRIAAPKIDQLFTYLYGL